MKQDMKNKDFQIKKLEDTVHGLDIRIKEKDIRNKNLQDKVLFYGFYLEKITQKSNLCSFL